MRLVRREVASLVVLVALRNGSNLRYIHLDSLGSTSVVTDSSGAQYGYTRYYPYGSTRDSSGSLDTNKKFTGQRLDGTGLYYYGARYYDPVIGRFISPDTVGPNPTNPQSLNKYSYCFNNPLVYTDPTGNWGLSNICRWAKDNVVAPIKETAVDIGKTVVSAATLVVDPSMEHAKEFGMNLGNAALGHGTVEGIATAIDTGDWKAATLGIVTAGVQVASNFVAPGGAKLTSGIIKKAGSEVASSLVAKGEATAAKEGVVYLRTNLQTGERYVGGTMRYLKRQAEHDAKLGIEHDYSILERVNPGTSLRKSEEDWVRRLGGPGVLANKRYEMNEWEYWAAGGEIARP